MRRFGVTTLFLGVAMCMSVTPVGALPRRAATGPVQFAQDTGQPALLLSAVQLTDRVCYAVTVLRPTGAAL